MTIADHTDPAAVTVDEAPSIQITFRKLIPRKEPASKEPSIHSKEEDRDIQGLFACPDKSCVKSYSTLGRLDLNTDKHSYSPERQSLMDRACIVPNWQ